jgi:multicomponent Na+:H+ antiporter subunit F
MSQSVSFALTFGFVALATGLAACLLRVLRGPSLADRVLAVDLMTVVGAGLMAVTAIAFDDTVLLDVALVLIVTGFVGTATFAQFIERNRREASAETPAEGTARRTQP